MPPAILVICTLVPSLVEKYHSQLIYLPLSNEKTDENWESILIQYQPDTIIFGLQTIDERKCELWRHLQPNARLRFIRKGTSLHRVDFDAAARFTIEIKNIPGVNAPYVAKFITDHILSKKEYGNIGVVGTGEIGTKVTNTLLDANRSVILFSRTHHQFKTGNWNYHNELTTLFTDCNQIAVCLPLTDQTIGIITEQHIYSTPKYSTIICISPPRIFSSKAIKALEHRSDLNVIFDHVASGKQYILESLQRNDLPKNFVFDEKAAASDVCQFAMGEAAILEGLQESLIALSRDF